MDSCKVCRLQSTIADEKAFLESHGISVCDNVEAVKIKLNDKILILLELIEWYDLCFDLFEEEDPNHAVALLYASVDCDREIKLIRWYLENNFS